MITTEVKMIAALVILISALSAFFVFTHHERVIGAKTVETADTAALEVAKQKADEGTKANIETAAQADLGAEHDQQVIDAYRASHPIAAVSVCRSEGNRIIRVPAARAIDASAAGPGAVAAPIPEVPGRNAGFDVGPGLDELVQTASRMAALYADRQRREPVK